MSDPSSLPLTTAQLIGNYCETLTFGIYLVTCCFCARTLLFTDDPEERLRRPSEIRWFILTAAVLLFVDSVFDDIIGLLHNMAAFVWYNGPGGANQELTNIRNWINLARSVAQILSMQMADLVLIYRCYVVYARRWLVIVPSTILSLVGVAAALRLLAQGLTSNSLSLSMVRPWWSVLYGATVLQNLLTTSLLVLRIWRVERASCTQTSPVPTHEVPLRKVMRVIIESGAVYTTMVFMAFMVNLCDSNLLYAFCDATFQATGITFNVLIMRCSPRRDEQFTTFDTNERALSEQNQRRMTAVSSIHFVSGTSIQGNANPIEYIDGESRLEEYE